jgi:hypothetical protein
MNKKKPFNLSKFSRNNLPQAFDKHAPERLDPYRINVGKPGSESTVDKLRPGNQPSAINPSSGGGSGQFENGPNWPSDSTILNDSDGHPKRDNGTGIVTDYGLSLHDNKEPNNDDSVLGVNETVQRKLDDNNRDRPPFNINQDQGVLRSLRKRLKNLS